MSIKQAIDAKLYPRDDRGRALVPMRNGHTATIYATDCPHDFDGVAQPIVGHDGMSVETWRADGGYTDGEGECGYDLLPPTARPPIRRDALAEAELAGE